MVKHAFKNCARWLIKHVIACAWRPETNASEDFNVLNGTSSSSGKARCHERVWDNKTSFEGGGEGCRSSFGAGDFDADAGAELEAEVDAIVDSLSVSGIFVPELEPRRSSKRRSVDGSSLLLQHLACSSVWVASLQVPGRSAGGSGANTQQPVLVKTHQFYSDKRAAKLRAAAERAGKPVVHVPTERDAMREVRTAVKVALASSRASGPLTASTSPASASTMGSLSGGGGQAPGTPVHVEVRRCSPKSGTGPDFEVVAVYPYSCSSGGGRPLAAAAALPAAKAARPPGVARLHVEAWLHDSATAADTTAFY